MDLPPNIPPQPGPVPDERFVEQIVRCQFRLKAYLRSMIPDWNLADDVLQETNLVLWRKASEFQPGTNFEAWALKTAHFQVLAYRLRTRRQRYCFDESLLDQLSQTHSSHSNDLEQRLEAMRACLKKLPPRQKDMIYSRYSLGCNSQTISQQIHSSAKAVRVALHRIRVALLGCIKSRMESGTA